MFMQNFEQNHAWHLWQLAKFVANAHIVTKYYFMHFGYKSCLRKTIFDEVYIMVMYVEMLVQN